MPYDYNIDIIMQSYKKGLEEADDQLFCPNKKLFLRGIPKHYITKTKLQLQYLTCAICNNIIWKAITCGQQNCFANYCSYCIQKHQPEVNIQKFQTQADKEFVDQSTKCTKCGKKFQKTIIPLINNLLSQLLIKCPYNLFGCAQIVNYDAYLKHALACDYRKTACQGCSKFFMQKQLQQHKNKCEFLIIQCSKCLIKMPQMQLKNEHTGTKCLQIQLNNKTSYIKNMEEGMQELKNRLSQYQRLLKKIIKGQTIQLHTEFYSSFPFNFQFLNNEVKLIKSSWNQSKQKFDFLHFYLTSSIKTQSPVGFQWKINMKTLKGNLLIGICSSLSTNSVDFVINRFGEIKKKESHQNKYKLIRKSNLTFGQGDIISFRYLALRKILRIQNQSKRIESRLQAKQITQLGQNLYSFYSLDTINDSIKFI